MISPQPSFIGRFRLQRTKELLPQSHYPDNPVLLFLPAFNEEDAVGDCIDRVPETVCGLPVQCLVIDDGSADKTAEIAKQAGAEVISLESNQGLGAAVRVGLSEGVKRQSSAIVFADADGEYPPEELENLVAPILKEKADYVVGSRFLGDIEFMRPHRRFGNLVLTKILSIIARRKITDGQTGYRAFSPAAAESAEVIHDFNYAQIITLDLLAKGYVYLEVPISYHFRTTGESFIKLFPYLRKVVPAVYKELNSV
jgi:glycosyltransferase involved in cell wall biosynthesis